MAGVAVLGLIGEWQTIRRSQLFSVFYSGGPGFLNICGAVLSEGHLGEGEDELNSV